MDVAELVWLEFVAGEDDSQRQRRVRLVDDRLIDVGRPLETRRIDAHRTLQVLGHALVDELLVLEYDVLALPVLDEADVLERADDVVGEHAHLERRVLDAHLRVGHAVRQVVEQHSGPVVAVADEAEVGERALGRADLLLDLREQVAEVDEEAAEALVHVLGQDEYARQVVVHDRLLLLGEVADHLEGARALVVLGEHVEEERLDVVVERLVVEKELGEQAQVLAVDLVELAVHFEEAHRVLAIDLAARRMTPHALLQVPLQHRVRLHVDEAVLAHEYFTAKIT